MGDSRQLPDQLSLTMKFLVVLALAGLAMAEPEADPAVVYPNFGYGYANPAVYQAYPYSTYLPSNYYNYYGKRDAEADPQLLLQHTLTPYMTYKTSVAKPVVYNNAVHSSVVYNNALHTPVVYNSAVHSPVVSSVYPGVYSTAVHSPLVNTFPTLKTYASSPVVSTVSKREAEAEADPLVYTNTPLVYNAAAHSPLVYNAAVHTPTVYNTAVHTPVVYKTAVHAPTVYNTVVNTPLVKTPENAVVPTVGGYIHSSHVGVCTNNLGIRVPC